MLKSRPLALTVLLAICAASLAFSASPASAQVNAAVEEQQLLNLHNSARATDGDAALTRTVVLDAIAREWAQRMADSGDISHRTDYLHQITTRITASPSSWGEKRRIRRRAIRNRSRDPQRVHELIGA